MNLRMVNRVAFFAFLLAGCSTAWAQDILFAPRDGEFRLGPFSRTTDVDGMPIGTRIAVMLQVVNHESAREIRARIVADLAELDSRIGEVTGRLPLPKNNCARSGENLVVTINRSDLSVRGNLAVVELKGEVEVWTCHFPVKLRLGIQPFKASFPIHLAVAGSLSVALVFDRPTLELEGPLGSVTGTILSLAGVDLSSTLDRLLRSALRPEDLQTSIPPEFRRFGLRIVDARFFANAETLAAEIDINLDFRSLVIQNSRFSEVRRSQATVR